MPAVDVDQRALLGALVAFRRLDSAAATRAARATRTTLTPLFRAQVTRNATTRQDTATLGAAAARVTGTGRGQLVAYTSARARSGGMVPSTDWPYVEFGSGKAHGRRRQLPPHTPGGRLFYPAVKVFAPTAARVYLAVLAQTIRDTGVAQNGR